LIRQIRGHLKTWIMSEEEVRGEKDCHRIDTAIDLFLSATQFNKKSTQSYHIRAVYDYKGLNDLTPQNFIKIIAS
jgi:hypothetical protein